MKRNAVTLVVVGLFASCGFPEVSYTNGSGDGGRDAGSLDAPVGAEGSGGDDARLDGASAAPEGGDASEAGDASGEGGAADEAGDSSTVGDVTSFDADADATADGPGEASGDTSADTGTDAPQDAVGTDAPACDKDGDHDLAKGGVCGSTDCDDNDARAYFGEPSYLTFTPTAVTNGDWNCNGVIEPQFTTSFSCGVLALGACGAASGFTDTPGCGATSTHFISCKVQAGVLCVTDTTTSNIQGCK